MLPPSLREENLSNAVNCASKIQKGIAIRKTEGDVPSVVEG
jgi:hypothetical protein